MDIDNCITSQCTGTGYTTFAAKNTEESKKESKVKFKQQESHISSSICTHYNQLLYFLIFAGVKQSFDVDDETQTNHKILQLFQRQGSPKFVAITVLFGSLMQKHNTRSTLIVLSTDLAYYGMDFRSSRRKKTKMLNVTYLCNVL